MQHYGRPKLTPPECLKTLCKSGGRDWLIRRVWASLAEISLAPILVNPRRPCPRQRFLRLSGFTTAPQPTTSARPFSSPIRASRVICSVTSRALPDTSAYRLTRARARRVSFPTSAVRLFRNPASREARVNEIRPKGISAPPSHCRRASGNGPGLIAAAASIPLTGTLGSRYRTTHWGSSFCGCARSGLRSPLFCPFSARWRRRAH
jgi:hypothetical protein